MLYNKKIISHLGLFTITLIWGFAFIVVKSSLDAIPVVYMLAFRFTIAYIALSVIYLKKYKLINRQYIKYGFVLGALLYLSYCVQTYGCLYTTAGKNAFLTTVYVVIVPFMNWMICRKQPAKTSVVAGVLALVGIGLLSLNGDFTINIGDLLTLICGFGFAIHMIYVSKYGNDNDAILLTLLQLGFAAIIAWIIVLLSGTTVSVNVFDNEVFCGMMYLGIFSTMVAYLLQNTCQKHTTPSATALILSLESVTGMVFSIWLLNETITLKMFAGCVIIFIAIFVSEVLPEIIKKK